MKSKRTKKTLTSLALLFFCALAQSLSAQKVDVRLSAREAWVGMPVVLQIAINNASDYEEPVLPDIDGCDIRAAGSPSQSSQITIINGRRSESRSVTMQYLITPRREGKFEIPSISVSVDGREQKTQPLRFVATKSETGDLLFVEIEGSKDRVFVGQPLDLKLKIWIKPFVDRERNIKLSDVNMWQMISDQSSWGSFADRLQEMAENNQWPGAQEVLRDDGNGHEREYYLYEIDATAYPKRSGSIEADDVQIVVNYPTALGKSRDPFEGFFEDSPFGSNSPLSQWMNDDFFGSSPFGNRLTVSSTRPVVGQATVDSTLVVDVPSAGRPADYRGAVGKYQIITQATPTEVGAGDPITLNIGVIGTGPMELVQAPPLMELPSLTADFKVADQSLAGFVKDDSKVFPTTIRPRHEGITEIPAIPFSFFDPDTETFQTVMSEPISITVNKSESLALDAIVENSPDRNNDSAVAAATHSVRPDFTNDHSATVLVSQLPPSTTPWWWVLVVGPPLAWLATLLVCNRAQIVRWLAHFQSARAQCRAALDRATDRTQLETALIRFITGRTGQADLTKSTAVGTLRKNGMNQIANELESFFQSGEQSTFGGVVPPPQTQLQQTAYQLLEALVASFAAGSKFQIRRPGKRRGRTGVERGTGIRRESNSAQKASMLLPLLLLAFSASPAFAGDVGIAAERNRHDDTLRVTLTESQQLTILNEAGEAWSQAMTLSMSDPAEANDLFTTAASKYQLLVDSGIRNSRLYTNLGNACLQSNQLGLAIANYEKARILDPTNRQLSANLELANSLVKGAALDSDTAGTTGEPISMQSVMTRLRNANKVVMGFLGLHSLIWTLAVASLLFWGIFIARAAGYRKISRRWAIAPLLLLLLSLGSVVLATTHGDNGPNGVIVASNVTLYGGDGEQFDAVSSLDEAQGHRVHILAHRGNWTQVKTRRGHIGWVKGQQVYQLN